MPIFMIGTQRSGSNMLRLMLNQLPALAAPHPPHIMERMAPLLSIYGELAADAAFAQLIEDVCRLVELNPVSWDGVILQRDQVAAGCRERSLIAVYGAVYDIMARDWGAQDWLCKSLTNVYYLPTITAYYPQAKFIYLYRDGRDVAASFKKAVVGEKHSFHLAKTWHGEQQLSIQARRSIDPARFFMVSYEQLTGAPEHTLQALCVFLEQPYSRAMLEFNRSEEAQRTAHAGTLWCNVTKPVMTRPLQSFLDHLDTTDIRIFETVAGISLDQLGYARCLVQPDEAQPFSAADLAGFDAENRRLKAAFKLSLSADERRLREPQEQLLAAIAARRPVLSDNHAAGAS